METLVKEPTVKESAAKEAVHAPADTQVQTYTTIRAFVRGGEIVLPEGIELAENTPLLVTILQEAVEVPAEPAHLSYTEAEIDQMTFGEQLIAGLQDIVAGRGVRVTNKEELEAFLDSLEED